MPTEEESREAARRLLEEAKRYLLEGRFCSNEMPHRLAKAVGCRYMGAGPQISELFPRLADLIDPGHEHFADATKMVDRDALLELADELEQETGSVCGVCMGKTARRIREACGAER